jgi:hypothetical protein
MRTHWLRGCVLLALVGLAGCSRTTPDAAPEDTETRLGDKIDVSLADWLKLSRAELAKKAEETAVTVAKQQEWARTHEHAVELLPQLHPGASVPVFQEAKFSAAGLSLPPYLKEGSPDAAAALHLARFGDHEAAVKLGAPADRLEALRAERNYAARRPDAAVGPVQTGRRRARGAGRGDGTGLPAPPAAGGARAQGRRRPAGRDAAAVRPPRPDAGRRRLARPQAEQDRPGQGPRRRAGRVG